ncbi:hypothetical protein IV203_022126 [Nitzschia inconspicua]|uniref:Uncharacterized protein n=1 Tax=Nitzschia inconspicua TaxID=303405 RepID=A0A9K3KJW9_9STRA|nr:hypothetical protein IV203_022126 [Nitzschia inconspicua]
MAPFSSLFEFVAHHHQIGESRQEVEMDPSSLSLDSSSSSSDSSTIAADPITRPLSEQVLGKENKSCSKRKVSFFHSVRVQFVESIDDYSDVEKLSSWYSRQEVENLKNDRRVTVKIMEDGNPTVDDGKHYFRGFENKTRKGAQRKQWNIVEAAMVVFDEQQMNHNYYRKKEEAFHSIADAYRAVAAHARAAAAERGLYDQRAALESTVALSNENLATQMPRRLSSRAA